MKKLTVKHDNMCVTFKSLSVNITLFLINKNILKKSDYIYKTYHLGNQSAI